MATLNPLNYHDHSVGVCLPIIILELPMSNMQYIHRPHGEKTPGIVLRAFIVSNSLTYNPLHCHLSLQPTSLYKFH